MAELLTFGPQMVLLLLVVIVSLLGAMVTLGRRRWVFGLVPWATVMAVGAGLSIAVATLTRTAADGSRVGRGYVQLQPLHTIRMYLWDGDPSAFAFYVAGNVLLFAPFGFFAYLALRRGVVLPAALTVLTSIGVEICQLPIYSRTTDVDDVLLNSIGGIGGVLTAAILLAVWKLVARLRPVRTPSPAPALAEHPRSTWDQGLGRGPIGPRGVGDRAS